MHRTVPLLAAAGVLFSTVSASAQVANHQPPKLVRQGKTTLPTYAGTVVVQVLVNPDGSFVVQRVLKSTNHANDPAALAIARSSVYRPAILEGKKNKEFYDFTLKFRRGRVASSGASTVPGGLAAAEALLHANKFDEAKTALTAYIGAHPDDAKAQLDLALAQTYLNDPKGAALAFDKAGTVPPAYQGAALKAYGEAANADIKAKDFTEATTFAKKAVAIAPVFPTYATLAGAEYGNNDYSASAADYEKARGLAATGKVSDQQRSVVAQNLALDYLALGDVDKAKAAAAEAKQLDPSANTGAVFAKYYFDKGTAAAKATKFTDAVSAFEQGAVADPKDAVTFYTQAAFAYLSMTPKPDSDKAKAEADKALAADPTDAGANYAAGVALANSGKVDEAKTYLNKADASAKATGNTTLVTQIEANLKKLDAPR